MWIQWICLTQWKFFNATLGEKYFYRYHDAKTMTSTNKNAGTITITQPDDWHVHLRDGEIMAQVVQHTAARFARAMVMPNLSPPITTAAQALNYREQIIAALPASGDGQSSQSIQSIQPSQFSPLMSLYLTDHTTRKEIMDAAAADYIVGCKLYPAATTTNSDQGVTRISNIMPIFETMAEHGMVLQVHGEVSDPQVDIFDREAVFIEQILAPLQKEIPTLKIILEHVTTKQGVEFVQQAGEQVAATITVHHLMFNRNEMFRGGIRPHAYCLPVPKREHHRLALLEAATSGDPSFFAGTDSAPHTRQSKESSCGCAGIYSAHAALELYAEIFESMNALDKLEGFVSHYGADFYQLKRNTGKLTLKKNPWQVPASYPAGRNDEIIPLHAEQTITWSLA